MSCDDHTYQRIANRSGGNVHAAILGQAVTLDRNSGTHPPTPARPMRASCSSKLYTSEDSCLTLVAHDLFIHDVPCWIRLDFFPSCELVDAGVFRTHFLRMAASFERPGFATCLQDNGSI